MKNDWILRVGKVFIAGGHPGHSGHGSARTTPDRMEAAGFDTQARAEGFARGLSFPMGVKIAERRHGSNYVDLPTLERDGEIVCRACGRSIQEGHGVGFGAYSDGKIRCIRPAIYGHDPGPGFVSAVVQGKHPAPLDDGKLIVREVDVPEDLVPYLGKVWYEMPNGAHLTVFDVADEHQRRCHEARLALASS
jgi:hypothetical protein